MFMGNKRFILI